MRTLAIGDVHGCLDHLDALLAAVAPTPDDVLVFLGDLVDRGPDSRGVLDRVLELRQRLNVVCVRGNHEEMMVAARHGGRDERRMWLSVGGAQCLGSYGVGGRTGTLDDVPADHWELMERGMVDYHETDRHIFVHATVLYGVPMAEQPDYALRWEFFTEYVSHYSGKLVVCGHSSLRSGVPKVVAGAVCIDTFAHGGGWLTCLDADMRRYWQANAIGQVRKGWLDEVE